MSFEYYSHEARELVNYWELPTLSGKLKSMRQQYAENLERIQNIIDRVISDKNRYDIETLGTPYSNGIDYQQELQLCRQAYADQLEYYNQATF